MEEGAPGEVGRDFMIGAPAQVGTGLIGIRCPAEMEEDL
jgi:hypothetical protein